MGAVGLCVGCAPAFGRAGVDLSEAQWRRALADRGVDPGLVSDPLASTPEMQDEAERLARGGTASQQLYALQSSLFDTDLFPFDYASRVTLTAREAFEQRRGNCVSFTNLFIALARSLGIAVRAAIVPEVQTSIREDELVVVNNHVVAVFPYGSGVLVFDFDRSRAELPRRFVMVDDLRVTAMYANNLGVEELRAGRPGRAVPLLEAAVRLAPDDVDALSNLGVALRHAGDVDGALDAYRRGLDISPGNPRILKNLSRLYRGLGRDDDAVRALEAAKLRAASPFTLLVQGDLERTRGNYRRAIELYRLAHRRGPALSEPYVAEARVHLLQRREAAAVRALRKALIRNPENTEALTLLRELTAPEAGS